MNMSHSCEIPRDTGYSNVCQICGVPLDAGYFDIASIKEAPGPGEEVELAHYELHSQYCGTLLYFAQFAQNELNQQVISHTPGYEWVILCNNQPRAPYLPTSLILNPWGHNAFRIQLRLEEGRTVRFVVRKVAPPQGGPRSSYPKSEADCWAAPGTTPSTAACRIDCEPYLESK